MRCLGKVLELWRYPMSSVGGALMERLDIQPAGVVGDREFALFDRTTGVPAAPEKDPRWRPALFLTCAVVKGIPSLAFPDGQWLDLHDSSLPETLTRYFGFSVAVGTYAASNYGQGYNFPIVQNRYVPSALHIVTTASLQKLAQLGGFSMPDRRRFRPTILIESVEENAFAENDWIGHTFHMGDAHCRVAEATKRCGMTLIAQPGIAENADILRNILRHNGRNLGVYCNVERAGAITLGTPVYADI